MATQDAIRPERIVADRRTLFEWYSDCAKSASFRGYFYLILSLLLFFFPLFYPLWIVIALPVWLSDRTLDLPLRAPIESNTRDTNDPDPAGGHHKARGAAYIGNEIHSDKEAWVSWNDQRLHDYIMGSTGSGKTELILSITANYFFAGSGALTGDGKGTMMFPKQMATLARMAGADDNHFVINFLSGYKTHFGRTKRKNSNSVNPFGEGNASTTKELLTSLMSDGGGENKIFSDGAASLADSLSPAWVEGRDTGIWHLDIELIGQSLPLAAVYQLSQHPDLSELSREHIRNYLANTGYDFESPPSKQPENCTRMHGYYVNYFMRVVTSFAISYRHIYMVKQGEVNIRDTVKSRRSLTFTLPSLEKSPDEVQNLGKLLLVSARSASSYGLGETLEGRREESIDKLPANFRVPYRFTFDEFSFYVLEGFSLMPAQLRGINISCAVGAQDFIGTERAGEIDANSIMANGRTKYFGALEDSKTWQKLSELIGEVDMAVFDRLVNMGSFGSRYVPDLDLRLTRRCPIELRDLQSQIEGEYHILQRGKVRKIKAFYSGINEDTVQDNYYLHRLVEVYPPDEEEMKTIHATKNFLSFLSTASERACPSSALLKLSQAEGEGFDKPINALEAYYQEIKYSFNKKTAKTAVSDIEGEARPVDDNAVDDSAAEGIPEIDEQSRQAALAEHEAAIDEWSSSIVDTPESSHDIPTTSPESNQRDLLSETQSATESIFVNNAPIEDLVLALTDEELSHIQDRYIKLGMLFGESKEDAQKSSEVIMADIKKAVIYLIPPKPTVEKEDLKQKVANVFKQVEMQFAQTSEGN